MNPWPRGMQRLPPGPPLAGAACRGENPDLGNANQFEMSRLAAAAEA